MKATDRFPIEGVTCILNGTSFQVADLSVGGFFVVAEEHPIPGQTLDLGLSLSPDRCFQVIARVIWINDADHPKTADRPSGFGVRISRIAFSDKFAIIERLRRGAPDVDRVG